MRAPTAAWCATPTAGRADRRGPRRVRARSSTIREFNAGLYAVDRAALRAALGGLDASNAQGELYLTDAIGALGGVVAPLVADDPEVASGVNDRVDLAACEAAIQRRLREELMRAG